MSALRFSVGQMIDGATETWFAQVLALVSLTIRSPGLSGERPIERL